MQTITTIGLDIAKLMPSRVSDQRWRLLWSRALVIPRRFDRGGISRAWIGLVPEQNSSGGKDKLGNISKQGDRYLRCLLPVRSP
jgi:hypothetical protein